MFQKKYIYSSDLCPCDQIIYEDFYHAHQVFDDMLRRGYHPDGVTCTKLIKGG
uniref:Putative pentatricopeptide repeat protein n=1 Tax=Helianthus annuus TaxID=4232 RepID=A0A251UZE1_HELAN